ncbi:hypothetical protein A6R68_20818 [Neotoma lepida]|uniref:Uncharacterized protein n=1 Tax=Neotoma lepida TaxID=56216 RepID=A0A1A6HRV8_NEOLE|nr:hypothetical protein A6R68_20818 [Neotoma lepida]
MPVGGRSRSRSRQGRFSPYPIPGVKLDLLRSVLQQRLIALGSALAAQLSARVILRNHLKPLDGVASFFHGVSNGLPSQGKAGKPLLSNHVVATLQGIHHHQEAAWLEQAAKIPEGSASGTQKENVLIKQHFPATSMDTKLLQHLDPPGELRLLSLPLPKSQTEKGPSMSGVGFWGQGALGHQVEGSVAVESQVESLVPHPTPTPGEACPGGGCPCCGLGQRAAAAGCPGREEGLQQASEERSQAGLAGPLSLHEIISGSKSINTEVTKKRINLHETKAGVDKPQSERTLSGQKELAIWIGGKDSRVFGVLRLPMFTTFKRDLTGPHSVNSGSCVHIQILLWPHSHSWDDSQSLEKKACLAQQESSNPQKASSSPWTPQIPSSGPLPSVQLRVYYMTSHVNQGSINAKSTAGLTYQTQLLMLNTGPSSKWAKNNRILMRHCVGGVQSLCRAGVKINGCLNEKTKGSFKAL